MTLLQTFAQLKEEEGFLLKERIHLNKVWSLCFLLLNLNSNNVSFVSVLTYIIQQELETLRATYKIQSAKNENLKRIKVISLSPCTATMNLPPFLVLIVALINENVMICSLIWD